MRRVHRQFFTKSFFGDDAAVLTRWSGEEPVFVPTRVASMVENAVVVLLRYVYASHTDVLEDDRLGPLEDRFWSG